MLSVKFKKYFAGTAYYDVYRNNILLGIYSREELLEIFDYEV